EKLLPSVDQHVWPEPHSYATLHPVPEEPLLLLLHAAATADRRTSVEKAWSMDHHPPRVTRTRERPTLRWSGSKTTSSSFWRYFATLWLRYTGTRFTRMPV